MNENAVNYYLNFSCSPCVTAYNHRKSPCDGDNLCLKEIIRMKYWRKRRNIGREMLGKPVESVVGRMCPLVVDVAVV